MTNINNNNNNKKTKRTKKKKNNDKIVVPQRAVQGGLDMKFESDPHLVKLYDILTEEEYEDTILLINDKLRVTRSDGIDTALLLSSPLLVFPLAVWGIRHRNHMKKRKQILDDEILEFNARYPNLIMKWNKRPESTLTIERRVNDNDDDDDDDNEQEEIVPSPAESATNLYRPAQHGNGNGQVVQQPPTVNENYDLLMAPLPLPHQQIQYHGPNTMAVAPQPLPAAAPSSSTKYSSSSSSQSKRTKSNIKDDNAGVSRHVFGGIS